jgi:hypothetical protein
VTGAPPQVDFPRDFDPATLDPKNPDMWLALYLDSSIPLDDGAKVALLRSMRRASRRFFLPFLRPFARLTIILLTVLRAPMPRRWSLPRTLHWLLYRGLRRWVAPEANLLILRHFHIGTELLRFIQDNAPDFSTDTVALRPTTLADLKDNVFLQHDLNIYLFVAQLGAHLRRTGGDLVPPERIDFAAISDGPFPIEEMPRAFTNRIDLQTAIEAYTPIYQAFLGEDDFWRASNSLQLDEIIGIYVARILGTDYHMSLLNNAHPLIPLSTLRAGWRLMLHGLAAEQLHFHLRQWKRAQAAGVDLRTAAGAAKAPAGLTPISRNGR